MDVCSLLARVHHRKCIALIKFFFILNRQYQKKIPNHLGFGFDSIQDSVMDIPTCGICGKRVEPNAVCCTQCWKWIHGRCTKMKKVTCSSARHFVCRRCTDVEDGIKEPSRGVIR